MPRRSAITRNSRSRTYWMPAPRPPGSTSRMINRPDPVNSSWYCGKASLAISISATPSSAPLIDSNPPMTAMEKTTRLNDESKVWKPTARSEVA